MRLGTGIIIQMIKLSQIGSIYKENLCLKPRFKEGTPFPVLSLRGRIGRGNLIEKGEIASFHSQ